MLLETLRERGHTAVESAADARVMPVILRIERAEPPARTALLEAAAAAALAVCLDDRGAEDGPWHQRLSCWMGLRIRKVARRARGAHWHAAQQCEGVTMTVDGAQARALVPELVSQVAPEVRRLQISGTELAPDTPDDPPRDVPLLWLNPKVTMTVGKAAAQVGHASMLLAAGRHAAGDDAALTRWADTGFRCAVRTPSPAGWERARHGDAPRTGAVVAVRDAGFTEVEPGTITVLAWL
ncbi:MAG: peptidyl-tRNA hydrolase [Sciscionella sp.]